MIVAHVSQRETIPHAAALAELLGEQAKRERAKTAVTTREVKAGRQEPILDTASAPKMSGREKKSIVRAAKGARVSERKVRKAQRVRKAAPDLRPSCRAEDGRDAGGDGDAKGQRHYPETSRDKTAFKEKRRFRGTGRRPSRVFQRT